MPYPTARPAALLAVLSVALCFGESLPAQRYYAPPGPLPDYEAPEVVERRRLPPRATNAYVDASAVTSLDGDYDFRYYPTPAAFARALGVDAALTGEAYAKTVGDALAAGAAGGDWATLPVPSNWEMHGHGLPRFKLQRYIWDDEVTPPRVSPTDNPVGLYRRSFDYDARDGEQVVLHFGGVTSAYYVYLNGDFVGYAEDSRLPSEFDVTAALRDGANELHVEVVRWSDGSYLEDQDHWRLSGIHRSVYLERLPAVAVWDLAARPTVAEPGVYGGTWEVSRRRAWLQSLPGAICRMASRLSSSTKR